MNGIDFLADTNILLYILEGNVAVKPFINDSLAVSVISEIELLGWHKITDKESVTIKRLLDNCFIIELIPAIKELAIQLKQANKIKLPDAVIAATAIHLGVPLLTADKTLSKLPGMDLFLLEI
jgi:predicted nucleic acid-binding protein